MVSKSRKSIAFTTEMVKAILDDKKTHTRRTVKLDDEIKHLKGNLNEAYKDRGLGGGQYLHVPCPEIYSVVAKYSGFEWCDNLTKKQIDDMSFVGTIINKELIHDESVQRLYCKYEIGDILYVKEPFRRNLVGHKGKSWLYEVEYKNNIILLRLSNKEYKNLATNRWIMAKHMPKWASRIFIKVTNIRVERLQDISNTDIKKEGFDIKEHFMVYWDQIYKEKKYKWQSNPWVWVIEFQRREL